MRSRDLSERPASRSRPDLDPVPPEQLRLVMGHFASGVVVVTAIAANGCPLGFTCQTFSSLSLDPPLISISPARTSTTWPRIRDVRRFCVNVLAAQHHALSDAFARSGTDKFTGVSWQPSSVTGSPVLADVCAWIDCTLVGEYDGGDHTIAVGRVLDLDGDADQSPLLFHRGSYGITRSAVDDGGAPASPIPGPEQAAEPRAANPQPYPR